MEKIAAFLTPLDLHPVVDHFTISLLVVGVLIDLVASAAGTRIWLRYMALTLMIFGAIAAGASYYTGGLEANRIFDAMSDPAKVVFARHAKLGTYMAVVFGVLALWRILIEGVTFFAGSRGIYLIAAIIAISILLYIGSLGGKLVYGYGVGTALMNPVATATPTPLANEALPTVSVPTPTSTMTISMPTPTPAPIPSATATAIPTHP